MTLPLIKTSEITATGVVAARDTIMDLAADIFRIVQTDPDNCHLRVALNNLLNAQVTLDKILSNLTQ